MRQFLWNRIAIDTSKENGKEPKPKKQDKEATGLRYVPWLFKDTKKD